MDDQQLIARPKRFSGRLAFGTKDTNTLFKVAAFRPEDEDGATIPGVTIEIVLRTGVAADRCKYTFTMFRLSNQKQRRVYQLEVVPQDKRSHNGPPRLYGPHEHYGDDGDVRPVQNDLCCTDYKLWLELFCSRICLTLETELPYPFGDDHGM
ncbi:hypothetical protein [Pseudomonas citronellolis]|uniref:hypothetical protein n=1 Tax=Pseudomonas citronellolis TaxID=53408 RepID=UPI000778EFB6|nr:hypothetical protein [Pseudomonas citronellolis]AMO77520.1 hypothetical protein PcP3B5_41160 [Pseudomonas citronellolis]